MVPDLFIVGATKCATSTLHYQLSQVKGFDCSVPKEPRFIESGLSNKTIAEKYNSVFRGDGVAVDGNPNNFIIGYAPDIIKELNPSAKVIIMVRNPVHRFLSHYAYFKLMRGGREKRSIEDILDTPLDLDKFDYEEDYVPFMCEEWGNYKPMYLESGCYTHYIKRFTDRFDTRIIKFEDYIERPSIIAQGICQDFGIEYRGVKDWRVRNKGKEFTTDVKLLARLKDFYKPWNERLFEETGVDYR